MSSELLRKAAALMRARAEKATPGDYGFVSKWTTPNQMLTRITQGGRVVAESRSDGSNLHDLNHLSYWHPAVALAVADWLDKAITDYESAQSEYEEECARGKYPYWTPQIDSGAVAVARVYLGGDA